MGDAQADPSSLDARVFLLVLSCSGSYEPACSVILLCTKVETALFMLRTLILGVYFV